MLKGWLIKGSALFGYRFNRLTYPRQNSFFQLTFFLNFREIYLAENVPSSHGNCPAMI
jgi:hypothetical protein